MLKFLGWMDAGRGGGDKIQFFCRCDVFVVPSKVLFSVGIFSLFARIFQADEMKVDYNSEFDYNSEL